MQRGLDEFKADTVKREKACGGKPCLPAGNKLRVSIHESCCISASQHTAPLNSSYAQKSNRCTKHVIASARTDARALNATHSRSGTICIYSTALPFHASIAIPSTINVRLAAVLDTITACIAWLWIQYIACALV